MLRIFSVRLESCFVMLMIADFNNTFSRLLRACISVFDSDRERNLSSNMLLTTVYFADDICFLFSSLFEAPVTEMPFSYKVDIMNVHNRLNKIKSKLT